MWLRRFFFLLPLILITSVQAVWGQAGDGMLQRCPTLARLLSAGQIGQIRNPSFTDRKAARRFALDCSRVADELGQFPALPPGYAELRQRAALAAEFLTGDTYLLSTSKIKSVVKLRKSVKIPPPAGFVYVKKYASESTMPPVVRAAFGGLKRSDGAHIQGVTIAPGRYIAVLHSDYQSELEDLLSHEMVHAYLSLASGAQLPVWFQEGAAVYFSIGDEGKQYDNLDDPWLIRDVRVPDDYKLDLHSFQYIEGKVGQEKLFEFIRRSVQTGHPDASSVLNAGIRPPQKPPRSPWLIAALIIGAALAGVLIVRSVLHREESW